MRGTARVVRTGVRVEQDPDPEQAEGDAASIYVRGIAFVDLELDGERHRWEWSPSSAQPVPLDRPATSAVVDLARSVESATRGGLLADARVAGVRVSRWDVESAPRVIELDPALRSRLVFD